MTTAYDIWLEKPYQQMMAESDRYEAALEQEEQSVRARLEQLTVAELLRETDGFSATPNDLLQLTTRESLNPSKPTNWSLDSIITALAQAEAKNNLETAQHSSDQDFDPPDSDYYGPEDLYAPDGL